MIVWLLACGVSPAPSVSVPASWAEVRLADGGHREGDPAPWRNEGGAIACPVMGTAIDTPADAVSYTDHGGVRYFFCCDSCEKLFLEDPDAYANGAYVKAHALDPTAPAACEEE
jgi:YHS domain-containing protein